MTTDTKSSAHPHEPDILPVLDAEGRCLICCVSVVERELAQARADNARLTIADTALRRSLQDVHAECARLREALAVALGNSHSMTMPEVREIDAARTGAK